MYKVSLAKPAKKFYISCDKVLAKKLNKCFTNLSENPYLNNNIKRLSGNLQGYLRYRMGDYRVVYKVDETQKTVFIRIIEHRSQVYQ